MNGNSKLYNEPIGAYYFKYENNELILLRLYKVKDKNRCLLRDREGNKVQLTKEQLEEFTMLEPDGLIVNLLASDPQQGVDTLCLLYRMRDINNGDNEPYAVCRQNIIDPFEMILNNDSSKEYVGVSISKDTCPENFDFRLAYLAAGIRDQKLYFVYKDDSFEDIMSFVNKKIYDRALRIIKHHMDDSDNMKYIGFNDTYEGLLKQNDFMYDFRRAFGILRIKLVINTSVDRWMDNGIYNITKEEVQAIEGITKHQVISPVLIKYDKSVDVDEIQRSYIIFEDLNKELYVISYDKGNYINREYDALSDQRDKELLLNKIYK